MSGGASRLRAAVAVLLALLTLELAAVGALLVASARYEGVPGPVPVVYDRPAEGAGGEGAE